MYLHILQTTSNYIILLYSLNIKYFNTKMILCKHFYKLCGYVY